MSHASRTARIARRTVGALLLSVALAPSALAQEERLARLDDSTRAHVVRVVELARSRQLPTSPIVDKALEGAVKHAPGPRIAKAVDGLLVRLEASRELLMPQPTLGDIAAGADALGAGVPREMVRAIRMIRPDRPVAVPLAVLAQLVAQGVPARDASAAVESMLRRGAREEQLVALNTQVQSDIAAGVAPSAAFDVRARGLNAVLPPFPASAPVSATLGRPKP